MTFASCTLPRRTRHFAENRGVCILINIAYQANHRDVDVPMHMFRGRHIVINSKAAKFTRNFRNLWKHVHFPSHSWLDQMCPRDSACVFLHWEHLPTFELWAARVFQYSYFHSKIVRLLNFSPVLHVVLTQYEMVPLMQLALWPGWQCARCYLYSFLLKVLIPESSSPFFYMAISFLFKYPHQL